MAQRGASIATDNTGQAILIIPTGQTTAIAPFNCQNMPPLGFRTPTGWTACDVTFQVMEANDLTPANGDLAPIYDETDAGVAYKITTLANAGYYRLPPTLFNSVQWLNLTCSTDQLTTDKTVSLILAPVFQGAKI